ncbi:dUTP diphosphatase [Lysinibacillus sp. NPDC048646]|uniref:dUTP diphosphatase n=1 Tax=Lysinibacillus sp. NPDC048646 TaxID=3390574 RepID=UPI003CFF1DD8
MKLITLHNQRLSMLRQVDKLTDSKSEDILAYSTIGDSLMDNLNQIRTFRVAPVQPEPVYTVKKQSVKMRINESEGVMMTKQLTAEMYHDFKAQRLTDRAIREKVKLDNNKFYKFKQDNGLIGVYGKVAESEDKQESASTSQEKSVKVPAVDSDRITILEKELNDFKAQLKDAMTFIESLKTENTSLNEQLWGNRLQVLYAKQAELETFIANKHGISIHDYLDEQQLAILVELAESANEWQGFKYWKQNKNIDREKLLEETVDVLHLILARGIVLGWQAATVKAMKNQSITGQYKALMQSIVTDEESKITYAIAVNLYIGLVEMLGFTWQEVETAYAKKHQENIDRQNNDY